MADVKSIVAVGQFDHGELDAGRLLADGFLGRSTTQTVAAFAPLFSNG